MAAAIFLLLVGSNIPTPLYDVYRRTWGMSAFEMAGVFAIYPLALVLSLIGFGRLSDRFGRRPVLLAALAAGILSSAVFALAQGPPPLFVARLVQALAVGLFSGAGSAALIELQPDGNRARASLTATMALALGTALGPLFSGILAQYAPFPRTLSYAIHFGLLTVLAAAMWFVPETAPAQQQPSWLPRLPHLDRAVRRRFAVATAAGGLGWLVTGVWISLVPSYLREALAVTNLAVAGLVAFVMMFVSAGAQFALRRAGVALLIPLGMALCAGGLIALVAAVPAHSFSLLAAATIAAGTGNGAAILGSLAEANRLAPSDERGETLSLHYAIMYLMVGGPILAVGWIATGHGFFFAFAGLAAAVTAAAVAIVLARERAPAV